MKYWLDLKELNKLERMLKRSEIPYEREDSAWEEYEHHEIYYPDKKSARADAIISIYSYGHKEGLLEQMGLIPEERMNELHDSVEGWLTAKIIFERIKTFHDQYRKPKVGRPSQRKRDQGAVYSDDQTGSA